MTKPAQHVFEIIRALMLSNQVRQTFIDYFVRNGHRAVPSSSLIPYGDNTILFTNAGMNQFKNAFLGLEKRDYVRAVTAQKVMRVSGKHNDLENVGPSKRHHTFFEMLGNFSFGDYFKDDAMNFSLELLEKEFGFERDRLWFTIYKDDDESFALWQKHGVKAERILRFGEKDNFWSMGPTGPCGPNSEIHIYTGDKKENNLAKWVNNDDDPSETTVEIWNNVFMQFNRTEDGVLHSLPQTGVDTGMGFERLCRLLQGKGNNYETDLFWDVIERTQALTDQTNAQRDANIVPYRVIADHVRAVSFLIGDGVMPGNDGRNYILRMILRRAMRFGRKLNLTEPFLYKVAEVVVEKMGGHYTELIQNQSRILKTIFLEEERFARTLDAGLERLEQVFDESRTTRVIPGEIAFKLYDTNGLPLEITRDEAKERGFSVDEEGYNVAREKSKEVARAASRDQFAGNFDAVASYREALESLKLDGLLKEDGVQYNPYHTLNIETQIVGILYNRQSTDRAVKGDAFEVVLRDTPFYVESGGQISDTGLICATTSDETEAKPRWCLHVKDTRRPVPGLIVHFCEVEWGEPRVGDPCVAQVDEARRWAIMRNHTATHLLQKCLRAVLGTHVGQQGSLVAPDRLRFDFSHDAALSSDESKQVSEMLNDSILDNLPVRDAQMKYDDAIRGGAMAFFSEKYGDVVRVVSIGEQNDQPFSAELCGGTHVERTGDIGCAVIVSESAVSAGVRRIEAMTGRGALEYLQKQMRQINDIAKSVNATSDNVAAMVSKQGEQLRETQKKLEEAQRKLAQIAFGEIVRRQSSTVNDVAILVARVEANSNDQMREMSDWFREKNSVGVVVLGAVIADKPALLVGVSPELNKKGVKAGDLIKDIASIVGGSGGGKPTLAQAGGKDAGKLDEALEKAKGLVASAIQ
jgi:alanyl-tRNA synthetase